MIDGVSSPTQSGYASEIRPLSISTTDARLQKRTEQKSSLEISTTHASFEVDSTRARSEIGYESFTAFMRVERDRALALAREGTQRRVQEGRRKMDILHEPGAIRNIAKAKGTAYNKQHEYGLGLKPKSPPDITWYTGGVDINYTPSVLGGDYTPGSVDISV